MHGAYITHHLLALRAGQRLPGWRDLAALLSGGMRQRVGFARAIVSDPVLLLMDEPFSALDVLTAETLRTDFMDLWVERRLPTEAVLLVTHNIEEAVLMCDRILVLGSHPGQIAAEIRIPLAHPRNRLAANFRALVGEIYATLTSRMAESLAAISASPADQPHGLPRAAINRLNGFVEALAAAAYQGQCELPEIAGALTLKVNELLPVVAALQLLGFAELRGTTIRLTAAGRCMPGAGPRSASACSRSICCASCRSRPTSSRCSRNGRIIGRRASASSWSCRIICIARMRNGRCGP